MSFTAFERFRQIADGQIGEAGRSAAEEQRGEYESGIVAIGSERWRLRTARVTPKKPGAFVAVWRRDELGETGPFASDDATDGLMVFVREDDRFGMFRFVASQLESLGVTRSAAHPGKRGFRVYPSWSVGLNRQALRTQAAQRSAFMILE